MAGHAEQWARLKRGRPRKKSDARPVAAFNKDVRTAPKTAFDRETGNPVAPGSLMSYAEALAQYHLRPESKFLNGDFSDRGRTKRRHVIATQIVHIGKEANKWEEQYFLGEDEEVEIEYGVAGIERLLNVKIRALCEELGERTVAERIGISRTALRRALKVGVAKMSGSIRARLTRSMSDLGSP